MVFSGDLPPVGTGLATHEPELHGTTVPASNNPKKLGNGNLTMRAFPSKPAFSFFDVIFRAGIEQAM